MAAALTARALLQRLQMTVGLYEELRQAMDGSLLQRFQDSLGDAFAALKVEETAGSSGAAGRRGSTSSRRGGATPPPRRAAGAAPAATLSPVGGSESRPDFA